MQGQLSGSVTDIQPRTIRVIDSEHLQGTSEKVPTPFKVAGAWVHQLHIAPCEIELTSRDEKSFP